jgi:effector-binding domain-containing protein
VVMTSIRIIECPQQPTAAVRDQVPMTELTDFFSRAFEQTMALLQAQGLHPVGAPFGKYYGQPSDTVDVEAGFPVATAITPSGVVVAGTLPGGRAVSAVHVGPYDTMTSTYAKIEDYFAEHDLTPGPVMWECYLTDPAAEPDPARWQTEICWPIDER